MPQTTTIQPQTVLARTTGESAPSPPSESSVIVPESAVDTTSVGPAAQRTVSATTAAAAARGGLPIPTPRPRAAAQASAASADKPPYSQRPEVRAFIDRLVKEHGFDRSELESLIFEVTPTIASTVRTDSAEDQPWWKYRAKFLNATLERMGVEFAHDNDAELSSVEKKYGVERHAMLGIAGVETNYGGYTGNVSTLQALVRLAFDDERRPEYFQSELENLFLLSRENELNLRTLKGSYAGALGIPQFMPSNYRNLGVSYDGDGKPDLWSAPDAIASIANYFKHYDSRRVWQTGQPTVVRAHVAHAVPARLLEGVHSLDRLRDNGVTFSGTGKATTGRLMKMRLKNGTFEYWLGLPNFETIRSYNPSNNYALAVAQLGELVDAKSRPATDSALGDRP